MCLAQTHLKFLPHLLTFSKFHVGLVTFQGISGAIMELNKYDEAYIRQLPEKAELMTSGPFFYFYFWT